MTVAQAGGTGGMFGPPPPQDNKGIYRRMIVMLLFFVPVTSGWLSMAVRDKEPSYLIVGVGVFMMGTKWWFTGKAWGGTSAARGEGE